MAEVKVVEMKVRCECGTIVNFEKLSDDYCPNCGRMIRCPYCQAPLKLDGVHCSNCGKLFQFWR